MRTTTTTGLCAATLIMVASTAACSGQGRAQSADLPKSMTGLVSQAKDEGQVTWASWNPQSAMQPAIDLFEKTYPGITVKYSNVKAPDQVSQLKTEQAAGNVSLDVANAGGLTVTPAVGLASKVDWSSYQVSSEDVFGKNFVYVWATPKVWAYNTDKVADADAPRSWQDVIDPAWSGGKISAESRGSFMTVWDLDDKLGGDAGLRWAKKLAALKPHYSSNLTQAEAPIESGQVAIGTSLVSLVLAAQAKGAPVKLAPVSPTNASESYLYVPKGAPHPAAGTLLTSFLSSAPAQKLLAKTYNSRIPTDTDCSAAASQPVVKAMCDAHIKWEGTHSLKEYAELNEYYADVEKALGTDVN